MAHSKLENILLKRLAADFYSIDRITERCDSKEIAVSDGSCHLKLHRESIKSKSNK